MGARSLRRLCRKGGMATAHPHGISIPSVVAPVRNNGSHIWFVRDHEELRARLCYGSFNSTRLHNFYVAIETRTIPLCRIGGRRIRLLKKLQKGCGWIAAVLHLGIIEQELA